MNRRVGVIRRIAISAAAADGVQPEIVLEMSLEIETIPQQISVGI
jgi:hypothetical protein